MVPRIYLNIYVLILNLAFWEAKYAEEMVLKYLYICCSTKKLWTPHFLPEFISQVALAQTGFMLLQTDLE